MLLSAVKFALFALAPALLLIWSTSPELWVHIPSSLCLRLYLFDDFSDRSKNLLSTGENFVRSLTCGNMKFFLPAPVSVRYLEERP
ncbi:hypothetical protein DSO57_1007467 [Entomophthora muscae]|uniref:Uncharacterized protein n=1 Tax=Entomophthora muscae TaxID=34485 RepID=A0ACC2SX33_9FUNG|nr:hypothetical protein DSO57_1007467 [Entomophthora muscae]